MCERRHSWFTVLLALLVVGALLVVPALDAGGQFLALVLTPSFPLAVPTPLVATAYVASEHSSIWFDPQASNVASRAPPTFSIW